MQPGVGAGGSAVPYHLCPIDDLLGKLVPSIGQSMLTRQLQRLVLFGGSLEGLKKKWNKLGLSCAKLSPA